MSQSQQVCEGSCIIGGETAHSSQKVTIMVIVNDLTVRKWIRGVGGGGGHLRPNLNVISWKIFHQSSITNGYWGEQLDSNSNLLINYKWPPNEKHFACSELRCRAISCART